MRGPRDDAGFEVKLTGNKLTISEGRFYIDGLLAECDSNGLAYESQPDLLDPPPWQNVLKEAGTNLGLVYLDVWERHITPLDDRLIREVALGGPDTATRVKTVWQLRVLALPATDDPAKVSCDDPFDAWSDLFGDPESFVNARSQPPANVDGPCVVPPRRAIGASRTSSTGSRLQLRRAGEGDLQVVARQRHGRHRRRENQRQGRDRPRPRAGRRARLRRRPVGRADR